MKLKLPGEPIPFSKEALLADLRADEGLRNKNHLLKTERPSPDEGKCLSGK